MTIIEDITGLDLAMFVFVGGKHQEKGTKTLFEMHTPEELDEFENMLVRSAFVRQLDVLFWTLQRYPA